MKIVLIGNADNTIYIYRFELLEKLLADGHEVVVITPEGEFVSEGGQEVLPCDCVILAVGQKPAARIVSTTKGIQVDNRGFVITRERPYGMTTRAGVFSSGDVVHGPATVVLAMKESKKVAAGIAQYIDAKKLIEDCSF